MKNNNVLRVVSMNTSCNIYNVVCDLFFLSLLFYFRKNKRIFSWTEEILTKFHWFQRIHICSLKSESIPSYCSALTAADANVTSSTDAELKQSPQNWCWAAMIGSIHSPANQFHSSFASFDSPLNQCHFWLNKFIFILIFILLHWSSRWNSSHYTLTKNIFIYS